MGGFLMYQKLDNKACEEYLNKFYSVKGTITVRDFFAYSIEYTMKNNIMSKKTHRNYES